MCTASIRVPLWLINNYILLFKSSNPQKFVPHIDKQEGLSFMFLLVPLCCPFLGHRHF